VLADVDVERRAGKRPFDDPAELVTLLAGSGDQHVQVARVHHEVQFADADEWWMWKWSYSLRSVLEQLPPERLDRLRQEPEEHIAGMRTDRGGLPLRFEALLATARCTDDYD
jgi:hypothetical protein